MPDFKELHFAKVDLDRSRRCGIPEVIFGQNKTPDQIAQISTTLHNENQPALATRITSETYTKIKKILPGNLKHTYHPEARCLTIPTDTPPTPLGKITICAAGTSDLPVAEEAAVTAEFFGNQINRIYDIGVAGIHRLLAYQEKLNSTHVIIAVAGMEGALPSVIAGLVSVPVIAVPTSIGYGANFQGLSALLGMLTSCGSGVTVVNIDNGFGAAYSATQITRLLPHHQPST